MAERVAAAWRAGPGARWVAWVGRGSAICHDSRSRARAAGRGQPAARRADVRRAGRSRSAGFGSRGRVRRRARFLRKARELAYRDLGGLVFNLHRFGQRNDSLVLAKLGHAQAASTPSCARSKPACPSASR